MVKQLLILMVTLVLLPTAARAQSAGAIAGLAAYSGLITMACALFVTGAKQVEKERADENLGELPGNKYTSRGFYGAGGISYGNGFSGHMGGVRANGGYRCHRRFAADMEFEGFYLRGSEGFEGRSDSADSYWNVLYNAKAFLLTGRIQPFIHIGFGIGSAERKRSGITNTDFLIDVGAGVDAWLTRSIALSLDAKYKALTGGASDLGHLSVGTTIKYKF